MTCSICNVGASKYKCPSCRTPYCSVPCWKSHKDSGCAKPVDTVSQDDSSKVSEHPKRTYNHLTDDTVPPEKLKLLDGSDRLKEILQNPHVRAIVSAVDEAPHPGKILDSAMQEPIFLEFVDECMRLLDPPSKQDIEEAMMQE